MEYVIPILLVILLVAGFVTFLVMNATNKAGPNAEGEPGAPGRGRGRRAPRVRGAAAAPLTCCAEIERSLVWGWVKWEQPPCRVARSGALQNSRRDATPSSSAGAPQGAPALLTRRSGRVRPP